MPKFHLIGQNIKTSLSPVIHNFLFEFKGLSASGYHYSVYPHENYLLSLDEMRKENVGGISITIPFKQGYMKEIKDGKLRNGRVIGNQLRDFHQASQQNIQREEAQAILQRRNIINTIKCFFKSNSNISSFSSYNTDIFGIKQCFNQNVSFSSIFSSKSNNQTHVEQINQKTLAVIIGGGATAEVFMSYFEEMNIRMIVLNRSRQKIVKLKDQIYSNVEKVLALNDEVEKMKQNTNGDQKFMYRLSQLEHIIVINTLPTSILTENLPSIVSLIKNQASGLNSRPQLRNIFFMDVNYRDKDQTLMKFISQTSSRLWARSPQICQISTGLDMLIWQGILQNHIFCSQESTLSFPSFLHAQFQHQFKEILALLKREGKVV